jgi:hypothetical protein
MLTHQIIDGHVDAVLLLVAKYGHELELADAGDHEAIRATFKERIRVAARDFGTQIDLATTDPISDEQQLRTLAERAPEYFKSVARENGFIEGPKDAPDENDRDTTVRELAKKAFSFLQGDLTHKDKSNIRQTMMDIYQLGRLRGKKEGGPVTETIEITVDNERFKQLVRQNKTEVDAILGRIPEAKAPFDADARHAALLATARSLRAHWGNHKSATNKYALYQEICEKLAPNTEHIPVAFSPVKVASRVRADVSELVDHFNALPKKTKGDVLDLGLYQSIQEQLKCPSIPRCGFTVNSHPGYEPLAMILGSALDRAAVGKGKERHANGKPFIEQPIFVLARIYGVGFLLGQAAKKLEESVNMPHDKAIAELKDVIVYAAAAIIHKDQVFTEAAGFDL